MYANFGNPRPRDRNLRHRNQVKMAIFVLKRHQIAYNSKPLNVET